MMAPAPNYTTSAAHRHLRRLACRSPAGETATLQSRLTVRLAIRTQAEHPADARPDAARRTVIRDFRVGASNRTMLIDARRRLAHAARHREHRRLAQQKGVDQ